MRKARVFVAGQDAPDDVSGADVVVLASSASDEWGLAVRDRAPNAVVVVIGESPQAMCEVTLFPRGRSSAWPTRPRRMPSSTPWSMIATRHSMRSCAAKVSAASMTSSRACP